MDLKTKSTQPRKTHQRIFQTSILTLFLSALVYFVLPISINYFKSISIVCIGDQGKIHTLDVKLSNPECLAIRNKRFFRMGSRNIFRLFFPFLKIRDLVGPQTIIPGMHDSHGHLLQLGFSLSSVDLVGSASINDIIKRVKKFALEHDDEILYGSGWDQTLWMGNFPTAANLDSDPVLKNRAIVLYRVDLHAVWVSGKVLDLLGDLPDKVDGGEIIEPRGCFVDNAIDLVLERLPSWSRKMKERYFSAAVREMHQNGLVGLHDAMVSPQDLEFFKSKVDSAKFHIRMYAFIYCGINVYCNVEKLHKYGDDRLTMRAVKLFADGALGSWGAAMLDPYTDELSRSGSLRSNESIFRNVITKWKNAGFQINTHCIGDKANKVILDIYEEQGVSMQDRFRIEHAQIMTLEDIHRIGNFNVIASIQPTHATSDMNYAERRLGKRIETSYAWRSLLNSGTFLTLGSDFPVEPVSPLEGIHSAVTRTSPRTDTSPHGHGGWYPEQKLTRLEALKGFTIAPAYASFHEKEYGSIEIGKRADFVVLENDLLDERIDEKHIKNIGIVATVLDGQVVYGKL